MTYNHMLPSHPAICTGGVFLYQPGIFKCSQRSTCCNITISTLSHQLAGAVWRSSSQYHIPSEKLITSAGMIISARTSSLCCQAKVSRTACYHLVHNHQFKMCISNAGKSIHELSCMNNHVGRISYVNDTYEYINSHQPYVRT